MEVGGWEEWGRVMGVGCDAVGLGTGRWWLMCCMGTYMCGRGMYEV